MKVILLQDVDNLGSEGEVVTVKDGFGRNYLIPKGWARMATKGAIKARQEEMRQQVRKRAQQREGADLLKRELEKVEVVVEARVGEENRIFGTVTPQQVSEKLVGHGFSIDRRHIRLNEDIRLIGVYTATVKVYAEVEAQVKVRVVPEGGVEAAPAAESAPATEAAADTEAAPAAEAAPATEVVSSAESAPVAESAPSAESALATEAAPAAEAAAVVEAEADAEPKGNEG